MFKKITLIILVVLFIIYTLFFIPENREVYVKNVVSPNEIVLENGEKIEIGSFETFESSFGKKNEYFSKKFGITEEEAFILGNLAKNWSKNILEGRRVDVVNNDLFFAKFSYIKKFENTGFCIKDGDLTNKQAFERQLKLIRKQQFSIYDTNSHKFYPLSYEISKSIEDFIVVPSRFKRYFRTLNKQDENSVEIIKDVQNKLVLKNIKIILSDSTKNIKPTRECSSDICKEIVDNFNSAQKSIDMAIYGYSSVEQIENALKNAIKRGVKVRIVYDVDSDGKNIYPNTFQLVNFIKETNNDSVSKNPNYTMHNKFFVIDDKIVITGSANLSHTDMSGFNSNAMIVLDSEKIAKIYRTEFEQMYYGKFHTDKKEFLKECDDELQIYFSPQDKPLHDGILPIIRNAQDYIYVPVFVITEPEFVKALVDAKNRGVDVKIILDALNASTKHSKHKELRDAGIMVKTENYAGKMHSKTLIVDDKYLVIGSMNFSKSGNLRNDENVVILKNSEASKFYREFFLYQWNKIPEKWLKYDVRAESKDSIGSCFDGIDNNYDGLIDKGDAGCR